MKNKPDILSNRFYFMLTFLFAALSFSSLKVSAISIRLPFKREKAVPPNFTLTAYSRNCKFSTPNSHLISLESLPGTRDSSSVIIKVMYEGPHSEAVQVFVSKDNEETVEVTVYIDRIDHAEIATTSRVLYANSSIDLFTLHAFDKKGNTFSSISSYDIEWVFNRTEIRQVPLNETDLSPTYSNGLPPHEILLQGLIIGKKPLMAVINGKINSTIINLDVVHPIYLFPDFISLFPHQNFTVSLCSKYGHEKSKRMDKCDSPISLPKELYRFSSYNESIASVTQSAIITAHNVGITNLMVIDQLMPLNKCYMHIEVSNPARGEIPDQWIPLGSKPSFDSVEFFSKNGVKMVKPDVIHWDKINGDYSSVGIHEIEAIAYNISIVFTVYVCEPPYFLNNSVVIPVGHIGFSPVLKGGSGFFDWSLDNSSVVTMSSSYPKIIDSKNIGFATITVQDLKIPIFSTKLEICVDQIGSLEIDFPRRELYIGEKLTYTYQAYSVNGKKFDYIGVSHLDIENKAIIGTDLVGKSSGFTNLSIRVDTVSRKIIVAVFEPLRTTNMITGITKQEMDMYKAGGPLQWPGMNPPVHTVVCGSMNVRVNGQSKIVLEEEYEGICTLNVQNEPSDINPEPIKAIASFKVLFDSISKIVIVVTDPLSLDKNGCNLVPKTMLNPLDQANVLRIPAKHMPQFELLAYSQKGKSLGVFSHPEMQFYASSESGVKKIPLTEPINEVTTIHFSSPVTPESSIIIEPVFNISIDSQITLYRYMKHGANVTIQGGSGIYQIKGDRIDLDRDTVIFYPMDIPERNVYLSDICIPEYYKLITVITEIPYYLEIDGPSYGLVDESIVFKTRVLSIKGNEITHSSLQTINWTTETNGLHNTFNNEWELTPTSTGRIAIIISADNIRATHFVDIIDRLMFANNDTIYMFVGENRFLEVRGGTQSLNDVVLASSNSSIVSTNNNLEIIALSSGDVVITASDPFKPTLGKPSVNVHVMEAVELILHQSVENPYVGSIIRIRPEVLTDIGLMPPNKIQWTICNNDNWEKLFDNSLILYAEQSGIIVVTASIQNLTKTLEINVDPVLKWKTPNLIRIPVGSEYSVSVENNVACDYFVKPLECSKKNMATIDENGTLLITEIGEYVVYARYADQLISATIISSIPSSIFLKVESSSIIRPILLDKNGQQYTSCVGVLFSFNETSIHSVSPSDSFSFDIKERTYVQVNAHTEYYSIQDLTLLYPSQLIHPQNPVIIKGASIDFSCGSTRQSWYSTNDRIASISNGGLAKGLRRGRSSIYCNPSVYTTLQVVEYDGVSISEIDPMRVYSISPIVSTSESNMKTIRYPNDLKYWCEWDAPECGRVQYQSINQSSYCIVELFERRLCPKKIHLNVKAHSTTAMIEAVGNFEIQYKSDIWGIPSHDITITLSPRNPYAVIPIKPSESDVSVEKSLGLSVMFVKKKGIEIKADFHIFKNEGYITLEHIPTGDRMRVIVKKDTRKSISVLFGVQQSTFDRIVFIASVIITCVLGFYIAYKIGVNGLLPPLSPYKTQ